jgi:hypothetical protein
MLNLASASVNVYNIKYANLDFCDNSETSAGEASALEDSLHIGPLFFMCHIRILGPRSYRFCRGKPLINGIIHSGDKDKIFELKWQESNIPTSTSGCQCGGRGLAKYSLMMIESSSGNR